MDPIEVKTSTSDTGLFWLEHGLGARPISIIPDLQDDEVAMEIGAFNGQVLQGVLRYRETGEIVPNRDFTARFVAVMP